MVNPRPVWRLFDRGFPGFCSADYNALAWNAPTIEPMRKVPGHIRARRHRLTALLLAPWGQEQSNPNPTTFQHANEERKCEKLGRYLNPTADRNFQLDAGRAIERNETFVKIASSNTRIIQFFAVLWMLAIQSPAWGEPGAEADAAQEKYLALPLTKSINEVSGTNTLDRYGIPFIEGTLPIKDKGAARVDLGGSQVKRIFLLGMSYTKPSPWSHPRDFAMRFFIGDELGEIRLDYADGSTQVFPLILGEGIWFGDLFYNNPEPFSTDTRFKEALTKSLRLYPPAPVEDANYVAVIVPKAAASGPSPWRLPRSSGDFR